MIEQRIRDALHEVADRIDGTTDAEPLRLPPVAARRRRAPVVLAAAAAVVVAAVAGVLVMRDDDRDVPVTTTESVPRTLTSLTIEGYELRLVQTNESCVVLEIEELSSGPEQPACIDGDALVIEPTIRGGRTIVWGIHPSAAAIALAGDSIEPPGTHASITTPRVGDGRAVLVVVDVLNASGTLEARDRFGEVLDTTAFDHAGPERAPKGVLGDEALDYAFARAGAIWAAGVDGTVVRLTDGTELDGNGWPSASPSGHRVLFSETDWDGIFWNPMEVAVRDGTVAERGTFASTWSPDATKVAGMAPLDDTGAPTEIVVADIAEEPSEMARIPLGINSEVGDVLHLAWDGETRLLVLTTTGGFWLVDISEGSATALVVDATTADATWLLAEQAPSGFTFAAIRVRDGIGEGGTLSVTDTAVSFSPRFQVPSEAGGASVDLDETIGPERPYLDATRQGDYLLGDGHDLFRITADGDLTFIASDIDRASAP